MRFTGKRRGNDHAQHQDALFNDVIGCRRVVARWPRVHADVVTDWNVTANALVANDVGNNPRLRTLAMVHVAMSDAINTVQNHYTRVVATLPAAPGASADAAAATAWRGRSSPRSTRNRKPRSRKPTRHRSR